MCNETFEEGANSKIRKVSSDQKISPLETRQPKLPVWLSLCASARYDSRRRSSRARSSWSVTSIPVSRKFDVSEFPQMDPRFQATNRIISCRTDQIRASVQPRQPQRFPTRGALDGTLTLSRFGGNTPRHYFVLFSLSV